MEGGNNLGGLGGLKWHLNETLILQAARVGGSEALSKLLPRRYLITVAPHTHILYGI